MADTAAQTGMVMATGDTPDWAFHLANDVWTHSPLLWLYAGAAVLLLALPWWGTRNWRPVWRALWRSAAAAFLFTPAVLACGAISVMPFPVLLLRALQNSNAVSCGAPLVALPPNAMTFAGLWLVGFAALWSWWWFRQPGGAPQ